MSQLFLLQEIRQFEALADALRVLRLLLRDALLNVLRVITLQEIALHLEAIVEVSQVLDEIVNGL